MSLGSLIVGQSDGAMAAVMLVIYLALIVVVIAGMWKTFEKAGQPGWGAIVPIYNIILLLNIAQRPLWWILLYLIPLVNMIIGIIVASDISKRFGGGIGTTLGIIFVPFIMFPILGFGSAQYEPEPA